VVLNQDNGRGNLKGVLLATPERGMAQQIEGALQGYDIRWVQDPAQLLKALKENGFFLLLFDIALPGFSTEKLLQRVVSRYMGTSVILLVNQEEKVRASELFELGVEDWAEKPIDPERLQIKVDSLLRKRKAIKAGGLVGRSEEIKQIAETVLQIAPTNVTVLIQGESGTGKELIAKAIHQNSPRQGSPFVTLNCGALAEGVLESELFGHERGAFTGALARRLGLFELANGGTIFLDEVGELPAPTQVKLLRVLEEREFMRVGGSETIKVNVRVVAATNRDLKEEMEKGEFRKDLYYRLCVVKIDVPPLRKRRRDIPLLIYEFIERFTRENDRGFAGLTERAMKKLVDYHWPGNVRELKNLVEQMVVLSTERRIDAPDIEGYIQGQPPLREGFPIRVGKSLSSTEHELLYRAILSLKQDISELKETLGQVSSIRPAIEVPVVKEEERPLGVTRLSEVERELIQKALSQVGGNRRKAAQLLGIGERTLYRKLQRYGLK